MDKRRFLKVAGLGTSGMVVAPSLLLSGCKDSTKKEENTEANTIEVSVTPLSFELPPLPYAYDAFTDIIDEETMRIHHDKHHQGYVNKLNKALSEDNTSYDNLEAVLASTDISDALRNNGGGHYNHTLFWDSLSPEPKNPSSVIEEKIKNTFQSMDVFKKQMIDGGLSVFGSGWVWLIQDGNTLKITTTPNQDNPLMADAEDKGTPLLGIDVWEHAYYLKYQNKRKEYLQKIMNIINWDMVEKRMQNA